MFKVTENSRTPHFKELRKCTCFTCPSFKNQRKKRKKQRRRWKQEKRDGRSRGWQWVQKSSTCACVWVLSTLVFDFNRHALAFLPSFSFSKQSFFKFSLDHCPIWAATWFEHDMKVTLHLRGTSIGASDCQKQRRRAKKMTLRLMLNTWTPTSWMCRCFF